MWDTTWNGALTALFACSDVDLVISCTVVCDPFDGGRKLQHELLVEYADAICGDVVPVDADDTVVFAPGLEACEELATVA